VKTKPMFMLTGAAAKWFTNGGAANGRPAVTKWTRY
jgi:hypothetical protein